MNNKLFKSEQIKFIDNFTIKNEPIESINLMERAVINILACLSKEINIFKSSFSIICGTGNNGGDGLVLARLLCDMKIKTKVVLCNFSSNLSTDCKINLNRFEKTYKENLFIATENNLSDIKIGNEDIIIDCLFGTGLSRPIKEHFGKIVKLINDKNNYTISVDMPSGLFGENNSTNDGEIVKADLTLTIQFPPISSMFAENHIYYGKLIVVPIGLSNVAVSITPTNYFLINQELAKSILKKRSPFDHKGIFGHALLVAGSYGKGGAAALSAKSCIKSGVGLLTVHVPKTLNDILQISVPEAMLLFDDDSNIFSKIDSTETYSAIGAGPGLGTDKRSAEALISLIKQTNIPMVLDADALNIISNEKDGINILKQGSILTPHPKEFERLFGKFDNSWEKICFMSEFSKKTGIIIVLKGGITAISTSNGDIFFCIGLNPGMATGGSGDVLTGIITSLLAQNYSSENAAIMGVYIHSKAGEFAQKSYGHDSLIASDIINSIYKVFLELNK